MKERPRLRAASVVDDQHQQLNLTTTSSPFAIQPLKPVLNTDDYCELLQISRRCFERMRSVGAIPAPDLLLGTVGKAGKPRHPRWRAETVVQWLESGGNHA